jgi:CubicO group peptidase (beta-lactamase class C family)
MTIQDSIQQLLLDAVAQGRERGVQVAAYLEGELVLDAWAGVVDPTTARPVDGDTLFPVFSTTKGMAATLIHQLVEAGRLDYETPIAEVWPEFGVHGKGCIRVRHALNHTAGLPGLPGTITQAEVCDWTTVCAAIAGLVPSWEPGTRMEYHAMTYGWILGEVARRVDGRPFAQLLDESACRPLGIEGMYVGIPDAVEARVAFLTAMNDGSATTAPAVLSAAPQPVPTCVHPLHEWMNRGDSRRACMPASNGIMTARAIARHYAALLPGGVDGVTLLPRRRIRLATKRQGLDGAAPATAPMCVGLGYHLGNTTSSMGTRASAFGHGGYGGSLGFADPRYRFAFGLTKNHFSNQGASHQIACDVRRVLGIR